MLRLNRLALFLNGPVQLEIRNGNRHICGMSHPEDRRATNGGVLDRSRCWRKSMDVLELGCNGRCQLQDGGHSGRQRTYDRFGPKFSTHRYMIDAPEGILRGEPGR